MKKQIAAAIVHSLIQRYETIAAGNEKKSYDAGLGLTGRGLHRTSIISTISMLPTAQNMINDANRLSVMPSLSQPA
jgi:hypothetical protein